MGQPYFRFKAFTIWQDKCAMKVCTDSCAMGALINIENAKLILDIGAGTGLLSLMLAQKTTPAVGIDALEIEAAAAEQARENIAKSPWASQITLHEGALQHFLTEKRYDLIVSNPPFYENHWKRGQNAQNLAMHSEQLSIQDLAKHIARLLAPQGRALVMLPPYQAQKLTELMAEYQLYITENTLLLDRENGKILRHICTFAATNPENINLKQLAIRNTQNEYTAEFVALLKPYYLHL